MKKLMIVMAVLGLVGCSSSDDADVVRQCGAYTVEMEFSDDGSSLHATINGDGVDLTNVVAASGAKYDGVLNQVPVTLWSKGDSWIMILEDEEIIDCK